MIYTCGVETIMYNLYIAFGIVNFNTNGGYFLWKKKFYMCLLLVLNYLPLKFEPLETKGDILLQGRFFLFIVKAL